MKPRRMIPPIYFGFACLAMVALHYLLPLIQLLTWPWRIGGVVLILGGIGLAIAGERQFKHAGTPVRPFEPMTALVETGPFRYSRNPMYLGMFLVLFGLFLLLGTLGPVLMIPIFFWIIQNRFVLLEEQAMASQFGPAYAAYQGRVRRWL